MKNLILTTSIVLFVTAASTNALATSSSHDGANIITASFDDSATTSKTYTISEDGDRNDSAQEVFDKALYKAAKKTLSKDYTWFEVTDRETEKNVTRTQDRPGFETRYERVPVRSCGLLGCTTTTRSYRTSSFDTGSPDRVRTRYSVDLEIVMGTGPHPVSGNIYDAEMVKRSLK